MLAPSVVSAQTWDQAGERAQGMGGAFVAVADDASAVYWNPAGLATGSFFDVQADAGKSRKAFVGAAVPVLAFAYYRIRSAVSSSADRKNDGSGEVRVSTQDTQNAGISLVQTIAGTWVIASSLRAVTDGGHTAFDLDLGTMASMGNVRVGVTTRNLRKGLDTQRQVRLGAAFVPRSLPTGVLGPFSVSFDADLTRTATVDGDQRQMAAGVERWWAQGRLGTRVGLHWNTIGAGESAIAGGLTVKLPRSIFAEGHVTKGQKTHDSDWGVGLRVTF